VKNSGVQGYCSNFCPGIGVTTSGYGSSRAHKWTKRSFVNSLCGIEIISLLESALCMAVAIDGVTVKGQEGGILCSIVSMSSISCSTLPGANREIGTKSGSVWYNPVLERHWCYAYVRPHRHACRQHRYTSGFSELLGKRHKHSLHTSHPQC